MVHLTKLSLFNYHEIIKTANQSSMQAYNVVLVWHNMYSNLK